MLYSLSRWEHLREFHIEGVFVNLVLLEFLARRCPKLRELIMKREPYGTIEIDVRHNSLETLEMSCSLERGIGIQCPILTRLSTCGDTIRHCYGSHRCDRKRRYPFKLECPILEHLMLSPVRQVNDGGTPPLRLHTLEIGNLLLRGPISRFSRKFWHLEEPSTQNQSIFTCRNSHGATGRS